MAEERQAKYGVEVAPDKRKRIAFIQTVPFELIGIQSLVSCLKGHEIELIITHIDSRKTILQKLRRFSPDFLCFTACTGDHVLLMELAAELKKEFDVPFIWGGPHPTFFPDIIKEPGIDIIVRGEAENILPGLIANPKDTSMPSCWFKLKGGKVIKNEMGRLIKDLDEIPFPDMGLYQRFYRFIPEVSLNIVAGRGCPFNCSFCYNQLLKKMFASDMKEGSYIRLRSPENVIRQIEEFIRLKGRKPNVVHFRDDTFIFHRTWVKEMLRLYRERIYNRYKIPFTCLGRADLIDDEMAYNLKRSGITMFFWAVESGSERLRNEICKKGIPNSKVLKCGALLNKYKIPFRTYNMMGLPTETLQETLMTVDINQRIDNKYPLATIYDPYPGTELADMLMNEEHLQKPLDSGSYNRTQYDGSLIKVDPQVMRLHRLFFYFVRFPKMRKFLLSWIKHDHPLINKLMFYIGYGYVVYATYKYTVWEMFEIAYLSFRPLVTFKEKKASE